ncbi:MULTISPECIES: quorum sensing histidine kinase QseC [Citrobacter]|jgi:two-component system sensor histidine kinase QseC|uniref:quorum sensing histidine kinase QseC n=1 Tax=Citrobacter TaxID=544 RepID=UPI0015616149|nr:MULTISPECIES: quorum sensing histidine kinase QseC [Citrobacter]NRF56290.1 two-component system sensor histidine kinase QseC [Citrobacter braakii]QMA40656.1 two-component system sensor histidine kinase QseC [Citrobacter freundii]MBY1058618.1 two-component system sensor histidine kinase QseC [Citrobacter europaeus]MCB6779058.1 two-component system sensor histidine kinase QseC [Citrobacter sp. 210820-DFI.7.8]MCB6788758.1 two-component system sensor histidine kinase QseC [Citrobacter sp. 21082
MKLTQRLSLRVRLTLIFLILASATWAVSSFVAWKQTTDNVDELFDTQLMLFAKRLSTLDLDELKASERIAHTPKKFKHGHIDDDVLTFAVYTPEGKMVLHDGDNGQYIPYSYRREGFDDGYLTGDNDKWRFVWLTSADKKYRIVVGQEWEYREDMALAIVTTQLVPWLIALPLMLLILIVLLSLELNPLKKLAQALRLRDPESEDPLSLKGIPGEVRPLVESLNQLFIRIHTTMVRERRFTSDAAHELRSPLTALKVQAEVAQLSDDDPQARQKALMQMQTGIERATRLVDQLLTLSRLDSLDNLQDVAEISLEELLQSAVMDIYHPAQQAHIDVRLQINAHDITRTGQPLLLSLMVRNLLDNAIRYSPQGSIVEVTLNARNFSVKDNGPGIAPEVLTHIGERFYRPPGQSVTGSGLGLSIVRRIATLHGMSASFGNAPQGGFEAKVSW